MICRIPRLTKTERARKKLSQSSRGFLFLTHCPKLGKKCGCCNYNSFRSLYPNSTPKMEGQNFVELRCFQPLTVSVDMPIIGTLEGIKTERNKNNMANGTSELLVEIV